jgi:predicted esterase
MIKIFCFHGCGQNVDLFKSLVKSLETNNKQHSWVYLQGKYSKEEGGWGWYKYDDDLDIIQSCRKSDIRKIIKMIGENHGEIVLLGFSEGGQFALDVAQHLPNIRGVVAISPSHDKGICTEMIKCPVVLVTSNNDAKVMKMYFNKWKKYMTDCVEVSHLKGHRVCLPVETRELIKSKMGL